MGSCLNVNIVDITSVKNIVYLKTTNDRAYC
jgi:hypothetical protein